MTTPRSDEHVAHPPQQSRLQKIRLQTYLARCGASSRRVAETYIAEGRVRVNGRVVRELGVKVDPQTDRVALNGKRLTLQPHIWVVLHKPPGTVCTTRDPEGRQTILDIVRIPDVRLYPIGRLDYHTSGVLLLTNDGLLAQRLMHPRSQIPRRYHVKVSGLLAQEELEALRGGVSLDDGQTVSAEVALLASTGRHTWVEMTLRQGLNRQIHRMFEAIERRVLKLIRVEFAGIRADDLRPARFRQLNQGEVDALRARCALPYETTRSKTTSSSRRATRHNRKTPARRPSRR